MFQNLLFIPEILVRDGQETVWVDGVLEESISAAQPFFVAPGHVGFGFQSVTNWPAIKVSPGSTVRVFLLFSDQSARYLDSQYILG